MRKPCFRCSCHICFETRLQYANSGISGSQIWAKLSSFLSLSLNTSVQMLLYWECVCVWVHVNLSGCVTMATAEKKLNPQWEIMSLPPLSMRTNLYITWREKKWMRNRTFRGQPPPCWNNYHLPLLMDDRFPHHQVSLTSQGCMVCSDMLHECQSIHNFSPVKVRWRTSLRWALRSGPLLWGWRSWSEQGRWSPWSVSVVEGPGRAYGT